METINTLLTQLELIRIEDPISYYSLIVFIGGFFVVSVFVFRGIVKK